MPAAATQDGGRIPATQDAFVPAYGGVQTRLLDGDLVNFLVEMEGARAAQDVIDYAECAAAQYTLIRGYGFARHVRTNVDEEGGVWRGDAVYTVSPALPDGLKTIDAEVVVATCAANGIPTV
ncbi:hypothetical protein EKE94_14630 [Mesobaculum littorinae]|uniref:Uncharacterized protein n=1 Tax=Mesobaculum littorinae TaxID=2486419 RepID=A0A438AF01_9RHOB|nr:hypothetical protein [Mesobaculum littorinae]RVV97248.1 hypothetical protein EKE94_14630 [Mesobaculum littorinae]